MKKICVAVLLVVLAGCATSAKFRANMDSMIGVTEGNLISELGPPQSVYTVDSETKILTYSRSSQMMLPGQTYTTPVVTNTNGYVSNSTFSAQSTTYVQQQGAPILLSFYCTINLTIHDGSLTAWHSSGNNCVSR